MPVRQDQKHKAPKKHGTSRPPQPDPLGGDGGIPAPPEEPPRQDGEPVRPSEPGEG